MAGREKKGINLVELTTAMLADERITPVAETKIREQLVRSMDKAVDLREALAEQLQALIDTRPDDADEYRRGWVYWNWPATRTTWPGRCSARFASPESRTLVYCTNWNRLTDGSTRACN